MNQDKTFLGTEPIGKLLRQLAIPTVIAQLVNMLYNIVDRIYIGHIPGDGDLALTGVGVCLPLILIVSAFAALVASGGAPRASIYMGKQDHDTAEKILGGCFALQLAVSALADGGIAAVEPGSAVGLWRQREHHRLRRQLYADLRCGHRVRAADPGPERLYHRTGLCQDRNADGAHRRGGQHRSGPHFYLRTAHGRPGRGAGHHSLPRSVLYLGAAVPHRPQNPAAAEKGKRPFPPCPDFALRSTGDGHLHHAGQRERHLRVF